MMKVSDPIIFGHAVRAFFADVFAEHGDALAKAGANPNNGLASILSALEDLPADEREAIEAAISGDLRATGRTSRWSTPTAASPTCTFPAT